MKNSKTKISGKQYTIYFDREVDDIIDDIIDSDVKYNHVDLDIDTKTGKLQISAFFECKRLETAYRRFAKIFDRIAAEVALLTGWNFIPAKKLTQNPYGWENENGDQIFHSNGDETLSVDINEDTYYIFGNMSKAVDVSEEIAEINAADIVAHFNGQDGANKFFKMRATELDGSEEDNDTDNAFDLLPALDELQDVDIDDDDNTPPVKKSFELTVNNERVFFIDGKFDSVFSYTYDAGFATEYSKYYYFERINQKHGCVSIMKLIDDEEEFFALMAERGACTIDTKPTRPLVETYYFDGGRWDLVTLEQEIVNHEELLFDEDKLLVVESGHHAAKIMFLPNGDIAYFVRYLDDRQWYSDFVRVDENEFWLAMAEREACTLEPVNNELIVADYELADKYNEFGEDTRRFLVNGEIITFCKGRWFEINSPKIRANINRSIYYNKINYNLEEWSHPRYSELSQYHATAAKFWWSMYKRGFMQRSTPFRVTIEHVDAPASIYEIMDLKIDFIRNGNNYDVFIYGDNKIFLATVDAKRIYDFAESIRLAFANSAGVTIDTKGTVTVIADEDIYSLDTCAEINRHAPEGWTVTFDAKGKFFSVKFNGKQVTKLDSLVTQKFLSPENFFAQFKPLVDKNFTPRDQFLADRYNELAMLEQMREEIANDAAQLKTLEEMIEQVKRDIVSEEFAG